jgi:membrane protein
MKRFFTTSWTVLKKSVVNYHEDDSMSDASSIAFYTIFSMPAILIIALSIGTTFYERNVVQDGLINQVERLIGTNSAKEISEIISNATLDASSAFAKTVGVITLIFSATTVFVSLQTSLNKIWGVKAKPGRGIIKFIINRLLSLAMVAVMGFLLLVSLVLDAALVIFQGFLSRMMEGLTLQILQGINIFISMGIVTVIFALVFKVLPDANVKWRDVWVGAFVTTILFSIGKFLIGFYLGNSSFSSAYGAAGSLVIILVWIYYSTIIVLFGAELTSVYAEEIGDRIEPTDTAVKIQQIEIEKNENNETTSVHRTPLRHS